MSQEQIALLLTQWAAKAARSGNPCAGRFISGPELDQARGAAKREGIQVSFDGGWPGAERLQPCFHAAGEAPVYTYRWIGIRWPARFANLRHSDLMGSLMSLGIDRSWFGDLILDREPGKAWLTAVDPAAGRLPLEWTQAGSTAIACELLTETPRIEPPAGKTKRITVSSLRLDSLLAGGMDISRANAQEMIRRGLVQAAHREELRTDREISEGTVISVRGFGRICLKSIGGPTKKDRIPVELELFTRKA